MRTEVLFEEYRADVLECLHHGTVCVVDRNGPVAAAGDMDWTCFYRSTSKPIQSLPIILRDLDRKYGLTEEEAAIFSGSHWADQEHVRVLESIMAKADLKEEQMIMLPTWPNRAAEKERLLRAGMPPRKIYHNCSGKHLGMMLLARELGDPIEDYWIRGSKTQQEILRCISMMTDFPADQIRIGVDGCGVPVYAVPFYKIATSYLRLQCPELIPDDALRAAVTRNMQMIHKYPHMVAGKDVICSVLTEDPDIYGKSGAQGVYACSIRSLGVGVVIKIMDGSQDEFADAVLHVLELLGYHNEATRALRSLYSSVIINDNKEEVGYRKPVFELNKLN